LLRDPSSPLSAVRITRYTNNSADIGSTQDWYFASATYLPDHVDIFVFDTFNKNFLLKETYSILSYRTEGARQYPVQISVRHPNGSMRSLTIAGATMGGSVPFTDFQVQQGGGQ
jgi:hypothetical protein